MMPRGGGVDRAAQRRLVAGMHHDGGRRRNVLRRGDQAVVFALGCVGRRG